MILLVASPRNAVIEHAKMFNAWRMGWLNPATNRVFDAGSHCLDYAYDPLRPDYGNSRFVCSPEERKFEVIGVLNQRLQAVPQRTFTTTSGAANRVFYQSVRDYDSVNWVFVWLNRDPLEEDGGLNLYAFAYSDPIDLVDPDGECPAFLAAPLASAEALATATAAATAAAAAAAVTAAGAVGYGAGTLLDQYTPIGNIGPAIGNLVTPIAPAVPTTVEMSHRKPRPSTYDKHTKPRSGGPEKKDDRMQPPPPPRGPKPTPPPKPPEYFKGPKQKNSCSINDDNSS